jgi:hypothetical protein
MLSISIVEAIEVNKVNKKITFDYGATNYHDIKEGRTGIAGLSIGKDYYFDNNLYFGGNINTGYNGSTLELASNLKLGYTFLKEKNSGLNIYSIISPLIQVRELDDSYTDNTESAMGIGAGAGLEYNFERNNICLSINHIRYYMEGAVTNNYEYSKTFISIGNSF